MGFFQLSDYGLLLIKVDTEGTVPIVSALLIKVELVELAVLVLTLFYELAAAVHVYVEILVQFDDALVEAVLFLYGTFAHVKLVLQLYLTFLLVAVAVIIEHTHHLGLCHNLLLK